MSRTSALILIGIIIILLPFSGLPIALRSLISVICGIGALGIGLSLRTREVQREHIEATPTPLEVPPAPPAMG